MGGGEGGREMEGMKRDIRMVHKWDTKRSCGHDRRMVIGY